MEPTANLNELIRNRRSIFPNTYIEKAIPQDILESILENANWAPTHRKTEPWRFKIFRGAARQRLSDYLGKWYQEHTPVEAQSGMKLKKTTEKPLQSDTVIAICMQRDPMERIPEWEEIAATAMAVQNMWLSCSAHGIGCYWSSPKSMLEADAFLGLQAGERCLGVLYMGYHNLPEINSTRQPIEDKVEWMEG